MLLENNKVKLSLLDLNNYKHLIKIAQEKDLIYYSPSNISTLESLKAYVQTSVNGYNEKTVLPFIIYDKEKQAYAGSTRFGFINHKNKVLHIGWTWLGQEFQGTGLNKNIKFLMLKYAFETLEFEKVAFRIDGFRRSTCCYSILKSEWDSIKSSVFEDFV